MKQREFLPYGRQCIEDDDVAAVSSALRGDFLTSGPLVDEFELAFAAATGAQLAVACNSGTAALHLAALALGLQAGDVVIVPAVTFLSSANVVRMTGADVAFADVDPDSGLMTPATFEDAIRAAEGRPVKAAIPVHLNGALCEMRELSDIAEKYGIGLVEDACHALGVPEIGKTLYSKVACFSTHPVKAIATGEGGMAVTSDPKRSSYMKKMRNHGMTRNPGEFLSSDLAVTDGVPNPWYYEMHEIGWNYRQTDIQSALGISQLKKLGRFWRRRNEIADLYDELLAPFAPAVKSAARPPGHHGWHLYVVLFEFNALGLSRRRVMQELHDRKVGTQVHYLPVHLQPYYRCRYGEISLSGAERYYARCLSLPIFPSMADADVKHVVGSIAHIVSGRDRI